MLVAIAAIGGAAYWDEERESAAALNDFAGDQCALANSIAALATPAQLLANDKLRLIEEPASTKVLIDFEGQLEGFAGSPVRSAPIERAIAERASYVRLSRPEAASLGLPARMAIAGIAHRDDHGAPYSIVVVATALRERDRESRAATRLVLALASSMISVLAFGIFALKKQRAELKLARDLAVAAVVRAGDDRLMRADRLATLGALATGIAHEVSTPLGVIVGRAEQLAQRADDERSARAVAAIAEQADRIGKIIRGFLALARGELAVREQTEPSDIVRDALDLVAHRFDAASVRIESSIPLGLPLIVCEPKLFTQALVNLLLNACDACAALGLVTMSVTTEGGSVFFTVEDNGHGISLEDSARVKEPFFTTKPPGQGTGLGLAIATEIVQHHGGTLTIEPRKDGTRGTCACVRIGSAELAR